MDDWQDEWMIQTGKHVKGRYLHPVVLRRLFITSVKVA
jgi:hypothetical protein